MGRKSRAVAKEKALVIFRKFKDTGDVIAIFPEEPSTDAQHECLSYMHIGQHGSCVPKYLMMVTVPATPEEYEDLKKELEGIGYDLVIRYRESPAMREIRGNKLMEY